MVTRADQAPPVDRIVFQGASSAIGQFRCPVGHPVFTDSGPIERCIVVFPRTGVWIRHEGSRPFVADPNIVTVYNRAQRYLRAPLSPDGDRCDWFAVSDDLAREIASAFDPAGADSHRGPFRFESAPSTPGLYLRQRRVVQNVAAGRADELETEEAVVGLVASVLALAHQRAPVPLARRRSAEGLRPHLDAMLERSTDLLPARSQQLGDFVAMLVAGFDHSHFTRRRLELFIQHATPEARESFARSLPRQLDRLQPDARRRVWEDLLDRYWADRRTGMPVALTASELRWMLGWAEALPEVASQVVAALRDSPRPRVEHASTILYDWTQDQAWVRAHPSEAVGLVGFLVDRESVEPWTADNALAVLEDALAAGAPPNEVLEVAEGLIAISPERARALVARLRSES